MSGPLLPPKVSVSFVKEEETIAISLSLGTGERDGFTVLDGVAGRVSVESNPTARAFLSFSPN